MKTGSGDSRPSGRCVAHSQTLDLLLFVKQNISEPRLYGPLFDVKNKMGRGWGEEPSFDPPPKEIDGLNKKPVIAGRQYLVKCSFGCI